MADMEGSETTGLGRKEKRKLAKKKKRKEKRREMAEKEREKEEAEEDPEEERRKLEAILREAEEERARSLKEFEERERLWIQAMELKKKKDEEEEEEEEVRRKLVEEEESKRQLQVETETECDEDDDCEYVEEGPAEIIWQGNEIIIKKKKVRIPKKDANLLTAKEDTDRPTSNPLPPQSEAFADHKSAQQALASVAQQVPNFGTEQDKAHCPFHLKTGACRFGQSCSRVHFYPDKSCTLLVKNMYNGPGLAWEQDEGLEYTDEEVERSYEEFYEDVHTEFLKFGEIVNFKVCKNGSFHLRGNVYVHYKSLESAVMAFQSVSGRYFAGKQVICEFVNVTRWKVAICGEYMKSRFKTCSHGTACNFIHCFRNPGGDYEWADWDKPPPKFWVKKMAALFGYSDEYGYEKQVDQDNVGPRGNSSKFTVDSDRYWSRRSRSRDVDRVKGGSGSGRDEVNDLGQSTRSQKRSDDYRKRFKLDERSHKESTEFKDYHNSKSRSSETDSDRIWSDRDGDKYRDRDHGRRKKSTRHGSISSEKSADFGNKKRTHEADSIGNWLDGDRDTQVNHAQTKRSVRFRDTGELQDDNGDHKNRIHEAHFDRQDRDEDGGTEHSYQGRRNDDEFSGDWSERDRDKDRGRHQSHDRKSLGNRHKVLKSQDGYSFGKYRSCNTHSGDDWWDSDVEWHHSHRRKRSRSRTEELEFSDDQGESTKKLKENFYNKESESERSNHERGRTHGHSSKRSRSGREYNEADNRHLKSKGDHESSGPGQYDERFISRNKHNRWESESPEEDQISRRKTSSVQSSESNSPGRYNGRGKSPSESNSPGRYDGRGKSLDLASEYCYNDKIDDDPLEPNDDAYKEHHKPRSKYSYEHCNERRRSRGSSRSSREKCSVEETPDSGEECRDYEENCMSPGVEHRSHGHRWRDSR